MVVIARAKHPIPSRTRQLSAVAPMVLRLKTWESRSPPNLVKPLMMYLSSMITQNTVAGWSSPVARQAHNLKVVGSNPTPATKLTRKFKHLRVFLILAPCANLATGITMESCGKEILHILSKSGNTVLEVPGTRRAQGGAGRSPESLISNELRGFSVGVAAASSACRSEDDVNDCYHDNA